MKAKRLMALLLCLLTLIGVIPFGGAFAAGSTVTIESQTNSAFDYLEYYKDGRWHELNTPKHWIEQTGEVVYCVEHSAGNPHGQTYTATSPSSVFSGSTLAGINSILMYGYPNNKPSGFTDDEARQATANALRFWLSEQGEGFSYDFTNRRSNPNAIRAKSGYEHVLEYENMNVIVERIPFNVHFKKPTAPTYMEQLKQMETDGQVSLRGLRKDATLFNEIVIDVNTMYFERNGGYEYAKQFYEEAYHFIEEKFGADNVISAVMHADEINVAATEELGKEVYHYHLHAMVLPVVEKEILWSKRCKDPELRGTVKAVVNQISHSKKWKSDIPLTDEKGNPLLRKNGKPMFRASYSILQDELFHYMTEQGFKGFQRGEYGSTAEHLTSLQYQIKQDKERLEKLQKRIQREQMKYEPARNVSKTYNEIDSMGQKTITGKMAISKEDYSELTALAKEGITSRAEINELEQSANYYRQKYFDCANALERMKTKYNELKEKCRPFLQALEHFPEVAKLFTEKVKQLFSFKEAQERAEKEAREKERQERIKARRNKRGMER